MIFNNGCQYEESTAMFSGYHFPLNHFSSLVSTGGLCEKTILDYGHMEIKRKLDTVVEIENGSPLWLEVVHGSNVSNRMHCKMKDIITDRNGMELFGIKDIKISQGKAKALSNGPRNFVRLINQYGVKGMIKKVIGKLKR